MLHADVRSTGRNKAGLMTDSLPFRSGAVSASAGDPIKADTVSAFIFFKSHIDIYLYVYIM